MKPPPHWQLPIAPPLGVFAITRAQERKP